jgi:uncharacterized protein involved in exopolysaccharide biosynthesis
MDEQLTLAPEGDRPVTLTARDIAAVIFRHRKLVLLCLAATVLAAVAGAFVLPNYQAELKILVKRGRLDPLVSSAAGADRGQQMVAAGVTEEELNSEVELLSSEDLLRQVVLDNHLDDVVGGGRSTERETRIQEAVRKLKSKLDVQAVKKADIITAKFKSKDPQLAYHVLKSLSLAYVQKHLEVHRPAGEYQFFEKEAEQSQQALSDAETRLKEFPHQEGAVAPQLERDITLQKLNDFNFDLEQTRAQINSTQDRIRQLKSLATSTPDRITTQLKRSDNPQLLQQLKTTLLEQELKRTELLTKFQPTYRPVQEIEKQIAETKAAIAAETERPVREETTDQNPTHEWVRGELAKAEADLAGFQARAQATERSVAMYQSAARNYDNKAVVLANLVRDQKVREDNYLLYLRKREEARINDALDKNRILNVALAEEPSVPALPAHPGSFYLVVVGFAMCVFSAGLVFATDRLDPTFRTPDELRTKLGIPVLAAIPDPNSSLELARHNAEKNPGLYGLSPEPGMNPEYVATRANAS